MIRDKGIFLTSVSVGLAGNVRINFFKRAELYIINTVRLPIIG